MAQPQTPKSAPGASQPMETPPSPHVLRADGTCLDMVREFSRQIDRTNPFLSRVLNEIVGAEIVNDTLRFWLLPKSKYHLDSIEKNYSEQIMAFFSAKTKRQLRLECRFTDEGGYDFTKFQGAPATEGRNAATEGSVATEGRAEGSGRTAQRENPPTEGSAVTEGNARTTEGRTEGRISRGSGENSLTEKIKITFGGEIVSSAESEAAPWPANDETTNEPERYE